MELIITRAKLKKKIYNHVLLVCPEYLEEFNNKLIVDTYIYIQGYWKCFLYLQQPPINVNEVESLLLSEAIEFAVKQIQR